MTIHALVLAGGEGSRLGGVRKTDLRLRGQTLLDRVAGRLRVPVLISTGFSIDPRFSALPDPDLPIAGPLAGLVAAVTHLRTDPSVEIIVTVAVDTPFLPADYVDRLVAPLAHGADVAVALWRGNPYPTNAAWRLSAIAHLPERAAAATAPRGPKHLLEELGATPVDWGDTHAQDPFANLNTLGDLVALTRRFR
jgi:molybdenum cofactor guanylyltransferase